MKVHAVSRIGLGWPTLRGPAELSTLVRCSARLHFSHARSAQGSVAARACDPDVLRAGLLSGYRVQPTAAFRAGGSVPIALPDHRVT